jgi:hypothetical protein
VTPLTVLQSLASCHLEPGPSGRTGDTRQELRVRPLPPQPRRGAYLGFNKPDHASSSPSSSSSDAVSES